VIGATFRDGKSGFYVLANDPGASPREIVSAEALLISAPTERGRVRQPMKSETYATRLSGSLLIADL
jgi:hypothetical protein